MLDGESATVAALQVTTRSLDKNHARWRLRSVLLRSPVSAGHRLTAVGCPPQESRKALEAQLAGMQATNDSLVGELKAARDEVLSAYLDHASHCGPSCAGNFRACFSTWASVVGAGSSNGGRHLLVAQVQRLKALLTQRESELAERSSAVERRDRDAEARDAVIEGLRSELAQAEKKTRRLEEKLRMEEETHAAAEAKLDDSAVHIAELQKRNAEAQERIAALDARVKELEGAMAQQSSTLLDQVSVLGDKLVPQ